MSKTDNVILKYLLKNYKNENFKIFTKFSFVCSFVITILFGIYFSYQDANRCHVIGNLKLNPIFTPDQILKNEHYVVRNLSKNLPGIRWGSKTNFEINGGETDEATYCVDTIAKFEVEFDKKYKILIDNVSKATFEVKPVTDAINKLENLESMSATDIQNIIEATLLSYEKKKAESAMSEIEKYTLNWESVKKTTINFKQLSFFIFLATLVAISITTLIDFIRFVGSKQKG